MILGRVNTIHYICDGDLTLSIPAVLAKLAINAPTSRTMSKMPIIFAPSLAGKQQHLSTGPQHITTTYTGIVHWNYSLALERKKIKIYIHL